MLANCRTTCAVFMSFPQRFVPSIGKFVHVHTESFMHCNFFIHLIILFYALCCAYGLHCILLITYEHESIASSLPQVYVLWAILALLILSTHLKIKLLICCLQALDLGSLLKTMLQKLSKQLNDPPFNFMIHSAPFVLSSSWLPYAHWFLQIVPQLSVIGGFELGSGCDINPVFPEDAAKILRELDCSTST